MNFLFQGKSNSKRINFFSNVCIFPDFMNNTQREMGLEKRRLCF